MNDFMASKNVINHFPGFLSASHKRGIVFEHPTLQAFFDLCGRTRVAAAAHGSAGLKQRSTESAAPPKYCQLASLGEILSCVVM